MGVVVGWNKKGAVALSIFNLQRGRSLLTQTDPFPTTGITILSNMPLAPVCHRRRRSSFGPAPSIGVLFAAATFLLLLFHQTSAQISIDPSLPSISQLKSDSDAAARLRDDPLHAQSLDMADGIAIAQSETNPMLRKAESNVHLNARGSDPIPDGDQIQKIADATTEKETPLGTSMLRDEAMPDGMNLKNPYHNYLGGKDGQMIADGSDPMHINVP